VSEFAKVLVSLSLNDLAKTVLRTNGSDLDVIHEKPRIGDIRNSYADISKSSKSLNFRPRITLENGLRTMMGLESAVSGEVLKAFDEDVGESVCGS